MTKTCPDRPLVRAVGDEPLPGYRLIAPLGQGGFGEVWKSLAPGGLHKAIKFVYRDATNDGEPDSLQQEYEAFEMIKRIRHPFLLSLERVELDGGELITVMELADRNLAQCFESCRAAGRPGIPREELLNYMVDAAEVLDVLSQQHHLQHLDIKPANLFLVGGHAKVGDYGLVSRFRIGGGEEPDFTRGLTPRYVAPEILRGRIDGRSDQYSLALVYQELLTGRFPYSGRNVQQLLAQHTSGDPDLGPLPPTDREAVRRALSKEPERRFPTCLAFVQGIMRDELSGTTPNRIRPAAIARLPDVTPPPTTHRDSATHWATQRFNPNCTVRLNGPRSPEKQGYLAQFCPGMEFVEDLEGGECGKRVRAKDSNGRIHRVRMLRLEDALIADVEPLAAILATPFPGLRQTVRRANAKTFAFLCPEEFPTLAECKTAMGRTQAYEVMEPIAATLDALHAHFAVPHGLVSPSTIVANGSGYALTDYGVGALLSKSRPDSDWLEGEHCAAPETMRGRPHTSGDQFALAMVYLELIGARRPSPGRSPANIDWTLLPTHEKAAVKRALAVSPGDRHPGCAAFVKALRNRASAGVTLDAVQPIISVMRLKGATAGSAPEPMEFVDELLRSAGGEKVVGWPGADGGMLVSQLADGRLDARFPLNFSREMTSLKIDEFRRLQNYQLVAYSSDRVILKPNNAGGVELEVQFPVGNRARVGEIGVIGRAAGRRDATKVNSKIIGVMEQFRQALSNRADHRKAPRFHGEWACNLYPIDDDLAVGEPFAGVCRDVSAGGFRCSVPAALPGDHAYLHFSGIEGVETAAVLVRVLRSVPQPDGSVQISGGFLLG